MDTFKRDNDRFWILSVHPNQNLIAGGSDSGMIVFNLVRERIPYQVVGNSLYYVFKKQLKHYNFKTKVNTVLKNLDFVA